MELFKEVVTHACLDSLTILPFLFIALLLMEGLEHYAGRIPEKAMRQAGKAGPIVGALAGCIPQCGFSVVAAGLYALGYISRGTLLAVFLATSDEALLIILASPGHMKQAALLVTIKFTIAVIAGYGIDHFLPTQKDSQKFHDADRPACQCGGAYSSMLKTAGIHTIKLFFFLFLCTAGIRLALEIIGEEGMSALLLNHTFLQSLAAAAVGIIPSCIPSVLLTQLYLGEMLSFSALVSGLCANAGLGLLMLFRVNPDIRENIRLTMMLFVTAVLPGLLMMFLTHHIHPVNL